MRADLFAFRAALEESLRATLPNPNDAPWLTKYFLDKIREQLAGQRIPSLAEIDLAEAEADAAELLPLGATVAAKRQGVHRSTVYRRVHRHRARTAA